MQLCTTERNTCCHKKKLRSLQITTAAATTKQAAIIPQQEEKVHCEQDWYLKNRGGMTEDLKNTDGM